MRRGTSGRFVIGACAVLLALPVLITCVRLGSADADEGRRAAFVPAVRTALQISVPASGELESLNASPIAIPRVPTGALKVKELIPEGSLVEPDDVVIVFDETQLEIELSNHRASFRSADRRIDRTDLDSSIETRQLEVMQEVAELQRDNAEAFAVVDTDIYSRLEILETEVQKEDAEQTILFAKAALQLRGEYYDIEENILRVERDKVEGNIRRVETSLANLVLKAPIGGLVVYKKNWRRGSVAVGDSLWPGNVVMSIVDPGSLALNAFVLEKDAAGIEPGLEAEVTIDAAPRRTFRGEVTKVANIPRPIERHSPVKYFEVTIRLADGSGGALVPGMKGEARILTGKLEDAVVIPRSAVRGRSDQRYVWLADGTKRERRAVTLGPGDQVRVSVTAGLTGGEKVLLGEEGAVDEPAPRPEAPRRAALRAASP